MKKSIESAATFIQIQNPPVMTCSSLKTFEATCYGKVKHLSKDDYYSKGNSKKIEVGPRTKASYFQYRAVGSHLVEIDGEVCAVEESNLGKKSSTGKIEWWIQVEPNKKDVQSGWLLVGEDIIEVKRKF